MKKLMIAAAVVASAIAVNAASFAWQINEYGGVCLPGSEDSFEGTVYLVQSGTGSDAATLLSTIRGATGKATALSTFFSTYGLDSGTTDEYGEMTQKGFTADVEAGTKLYAYFAALYNDGENDYLYLSSVQNGTAQKSSATPLYYNEYDASAADAKSLTTAYSGAGWYDVTTSDVPEPTSAMLMLIGMAGLALRRRRA